MTDWDDYDRDLDDEPRPVTSHAEALGLIWDRHAASEWWREYRDAQYVMQALAGSLYHRPPFDFSAALIRELMPKISTDLRPIEFDPIVSKIQHGDVTVIGGQLVVSRQLLDRA